MLNFGMNPANIVTRSQTYPCELLPVQAEGHLSYIDLNVPRFVCELALFIILQRLGWPTTSHPCASSQLRNYPRGLIVHQLYPVMDGELLTGKIKAVCSNPVDGTDHVVTFDIGSTDSTDFARRSALQIIYAALFGELSERAIHAISAMKKASLQACSLLNLPQGFPAAMDVRRSMLASPAAILVLSGWETVESETGTLEVPSPGSSLSFFGSGLTITRSDGDQTVIATISSSENDFFPNQLLGSAVPLILSLLFEKPTWVCADVPDQPSAWSQLSATSSADRPLWVLDSIQSDSATFLLDEAAIGGRLFRAMEGEAGTILTVANEQGPIPSDVIGLSAGVNNPWLGQLLAQPAVRVSGLRGPLTQLIERLGDPTEFGEGTCALAIHEILMRIGSSESHASVMSLLLNLFEGSSPSEEQLTNMLSFLELQQKVTQKLIVRVAAVINKKPSLTQAENLVAATVGSLAAEGAKKSLKKLEDYHV